MTGAQEEELNPLGPVQEQVKPRVSGFLNTRLEPGQGVFAVGVGGAGTGKTVKVSVVSVLLHPWVCNLIV